MSAAVLGSYLWQPGVSSPVVVYVRLSRGALPLESRTVASVGKVALGLLAHWLAMTSLRPRIQLLAPSMAPGATSRRALKRTHDDADVPLPALEPVLLNLVPPQDVRCCVFPTLEARDEDESVYALPIDDPENVEPARDACCVCAVGCRRWPNHVGLCLTEHGLAPPSVKRRHALSKMRHSTVGTQVFATLDLGALPAKPNFTPNLKAALNQGQSARAGQHRDKCAGPQA